MKNLKKLFSILNYNQKKSAAILIILILIGALLELIGLGLIIPVINFFLNSNNYNSYFFNNSSFFLNFKNKVSGQDLFLILFIIYLLKNIFLSFLAWFQFKWASKIQIFFSKKLFKNYLNKTFLFHKNTNSAELFKNLEEVDMFGRSLNSALAFLTEIIVICSIFLFLLFIEIFAALTCLLFFLSVAFILYKNFKKKLLDLGLERQKYLKERVQTIRESFGAGIRDIKINNKEKEFLEIYDKINEKYCKVGLIASTIQELPRYIFEQISILILLILLYVLNILEKSNYEIISILGVFLIATFRIMPSIRKLLHSYQYVNFGTASINLIKNETDETCTMLDKIDEVQKLKKIKFENYINLKRINFYYYKDKNIFENLNLKIKKNNIYGFIGKSGEGKSTLIDIFAGLIKPQKGTVDIDGNILENENIKNWQNEIGYVPQNIYLLDATIKENIVFSKNKNNIDKTQFELSLEQAGLKEFVENLDKREETSVGEVGSKISGGQIQRLGIARALYKKPQILILDEATSSLDDETEKVIFKTILNLKNKLTILIVTHKKNNLNICDEIFEIKNKNISKISY